MEIAERCRTKRGRIEVNKDWGFTRFDFRNDDGEIVSYEMVKK